MRERSNRTLALLMSAVLLLAMMCSGQGLAQDGGWVYINGFMPLDAEIAYQRYWVGDESRPTAPSELKLPGTLSISGVNTPGDGTESYSGDGVPVNWVCPTNYAGAVGSYTFTPKWDAEKYELGENVAIPAVTVEITEFPVGVTVMSGVEDYVTFTPPESEGLNFGRGLRGRYDGKSLKKTITITNISSESVRVYITSVLQEVDGVGKTLSNKRFVVEGRTGKIDLPANGKYEVSIYPMDNLTARQINANIVFDVALPDGNGGFKKTISVSCPLTFEVFLPVINVSTRGLGEGEVQLGKGLNDASVVFALSDGTYADPIVKEDFAVSGLVAGLTAGEPVRVNDTTVAVPITGSPLIASAEGIPLTLPLSVSKENVVDAQEAVALSGAAKVGPIGKGDGGAVSVPEVSGMPGKTNIRVDAVTVTPEMQIPEYAISTSSQPVPTSGWQFSPAFNHLTENTTYYVFARAAENDYFTAGAAQVSAPISTASEFAVTCSPPNGLTFTAEEGYDVGEVGQSITLTNNSPNTVRIYFSAEWRYFMEFSEDPFVDIPSGRSEVVPIDPQKDLEAGTYTETILISGQVNGEAMGMEYDVTFIVTASEEAPKMSPTGSLSLPVGTGGVVTIVATGSPAPTFSLRGAPKGVTIDETGGGLNIGSNLAVGTYTFTIIASNGVEPDATQAFTLNIIGGSFVPVTDIVQGFPRMIAEGARTPLRGTVEPANATNQSILFSVKDQGTTGAEIENGELYTPGIGTLVLTATVIDGAAIGRDYVKDFTIQVKAEADLPVYYAVKVSASPQKGGAVSGGGEYEEGQVCTVEAKANSGYAFVNWTEDGEVVSSKESYRFTVDGDRALVANFEVDEDAEDDEDDSIPQTGDDSVNPWIWAWAFIPALLIAALAMAQILRQRRIIGGK